MPEAGQPARVLRTPAGAQLGTTGAVGLLLAGRYRLQEQRGQVLDSSSWEAHDEQLRRPVLVTVVAGGHVEDAVDAARRVAGLGDPRIARVLDVGDARATDGSVIGWVVQERPGGVRLAELVAGPGAALDAVRARAVVGEAAAALEHAGTAGLHHLRLDPSCLYVDDAGVVLTGLAVTAAAEGADGGPALEADREDAVGLVSLLYAALSGLWPHGRHGRLAAAPRTPAGPAPLRDVVEDPSSVPNDLDTLASVTLGPLDDGPFSPREVVAQLAPWAAAAGSSRSGSLVLPDTPGAARHRGPARGSGSGPGGAPDGEDDGGRSDGATRRVPTAQLLPPAARGPRGARPGTSPAGGPRGAQAGPPRGAWLRPPEGPSPSAARGSRLAAPRGAPPGLVTARQRSPGAQEARSDLDPLIAALATTSSTASAAPRPLRRRARAAVVAVLVVSLIGAVAVAWQQLPQVRGALGAVPGSPASADAERDPTAGAAPVEPAPPVSPVVAGITALDPFGDVTENDDRLGRATDADPATRWDSSTYVSAALGGLKSGVGVDLALAEEASVREVELLVGGGGGAVEVRTSPDGTFENSAVVATATVGDGAGGPVVVALEQPVTTSHVVLWFTTLPTTPDGYVVQLYSAVVR